MSGSPICVADNFHFSHYYWKGAITDQSETDGEDNQPLAPQPVKAEDIKLKFYAKVLENENIHFGKWDGIALDAPDAYVKAGEQMTQYMYDLAMNLLPHRRDASDLSFVDLGSGTGASALQLMQKHPGQAFCLNVCHEQNIEALKKTAQSNLGHKIQVVQGNFEEAPFSDHSFDLAFSQDAFMHAVSKRTAYAEAFRLTKPGGTFVFCDLVAGPETASDELQLFAQHNVINDFLTPLKNVEALKSVGWGQVDWIDLTSDMRISFQLMLKKVHFTLEHGHPSDRVLLQHYSQKIKNRILQIDRGLFKWCVFHARKPVVLDLMCKPPVPFVNTSDLILMKEDIGAEDPQQDTTIAVIDIITKMPREKIEALPSSVSVLITLSAGLDHIDMAACKERGIAVKQAGREAITSHVVQYTLAFIIIGLREALPQLGVPFPSKGWNLNWNIPGKPLTHCKVAIVGMGIIGKELVRQMRALAPDTEILYHVPAMFREMDVEADYKLSYRADLSTMASECDILVPLCPLTKHTQNMINGDVLSKLQPHAGLLNFARGGVVDTEALTQALEAKKFRYAILDTTAPEPLPADHRLWNLSNCYILPHFATNTMAVREALVADIQPIVEECFGLGHHDEKLRRQEKSLRYDLAVCHRLVAKMNMDMLVWNHISARFQNGCLITPGRKLWNQVSPKDLVFSSTNVTADIIHAAVYSARPDIHAIIHLHTPAAVAVSCLESGFVPMTQDAAYFYNKVANYDWDGVSDDASEGPKLAEAVRSVPGCNTLLMHNHGFVCFGASVKEVFVLAYYFERACETQLRLLQTGAKIRMPNPKVMEKAAEASYLPEFAPGVCEWDALCDEVSFD